MSILANSSANLNVLVKNCETHRFLRNDEDWTLEPCEAKVFPSSLEAVDFCLNHKIEKVELVLKAQDERYDVHLPLSRECREE